MTNPTDASFRSYLTELSFRRHLRELHRPSVPAEGELDDFSPSVGHHKPAHNRLQTTSHTANGRTPSSASQSDSHARALSSAADAAGPSPSPPSPSHLIPFRFANRVSISLRTPPYVFRDFAFFSLVTVSPNQAAASLSKGQSGGIGRQASWLDAEQAESLLAGVWFIGIFGRWWMAGSVRSQVDPLAAGEDERRAGVIGLKALDGSEDPVAAGEFSPTELVTSRSPAARRRPSAAEAHLALASVSHLSAVRKAVTGPDSSALGVAAPASPSRLSARASRPRSRRPSLDATSSPLPEKPTPVLSPAPEHHPILPLQQQRPLLQEQETPSHRTSSSSSLDLLPSAPSASTADTSTSLPIIKPALLASNPALADLHSALAASEASTADLRSQLGQSSAASEGAQAQLQASLDSLRLRKREEDSDRLEVKGRTKALEDGKRQAEAAKREADKKFKVTEGLRDAVLARIEVLTRQVNEAKERMSTQRAEVAASNETIGTREGELKQETSSKRDQVGTVEEGLVSLGTQVKELDSRARDEEAKLEVSKQEAVAAFEAEMRKQQAAFATFGAPQPRSVENDFYAHQPGPPPHLPPSSSAPNPASLFDLPIQQLPLSLLHRRRQLTEPVGPTANDFGPGLPLNHAPSSFSLNDVFGFEDFGPGVVPNNQARGYDYGSSQQTDPYPNYPSNSRQAPSHVQTDDYSTDEDPGSPGPMSASFTNLLPRGLFQSLSAEGLLSPDMAGDPSSPFTAAYQRASLDSDESFLLDIDTQTEQPGSRRLSLTDADIFFPADEDVDEGDDQVFDMPQRALSDAYLPSSPRSVFSDDPRSLLLDPSSDENFSYPPPGTDSHGAPHHPSLLDFIDRSSPTVSSARPGSSSHQSQSSDDPFLRQKATSPANADGQPSVLPAIPRGIRRMDEVVEREPEDDDDEHLSPEVEHASTAATEKPASKFTPKRWFSSNKTHAGQGDVSPSPGSTPLPPAIQHTNSSNSVLSGTSSVDPKLNPDAKAFSLKGFPSLRSSSNPSHSHTNLFGRPLAPTTSDLSVASAPFIPSAPVRLSSDAVTRPLADDFNPAHHASASPGGGSNTSRFFSSLRAFAPSAAEREALTRALRSNGSSKSIDGFMGGDGPGASPTYTHASPYGYSANGGRGGGGQVGRASPFATPQTSASDLALGSGDRRAAAAWDNAPTGGPVERPTVDASANRRKSFRSVMPSSSNLPWVAGTLIRACCVLTLLPPDCSLDFARYRFFSLASSFSRKPTASEEDLHATDSLAPGTPRTSHDSANDDDAAPSEARSSGATIVNDWARPWGKKGKEIEAEAKVAEVKEVKVEADEQAPAETTTTA